MNEQRDVAIMFTQLRSGSPTNSKTRNAGWLIGQPADKVALTSKAIRQLTNSAVAVQTVPIFNPADLPNNVTQPPPAYAVWSVSDQLTLHVDGLPAGPLTLPTTRQTFIAERVCALPLAIAADTAITCAVILCIGAGGYH